MRGGVVVERCDRHEAPTLADMGLTKDESSRYQQLAAMPAEHFETAVATAKATAGEVTTAFMLREAKRHAPPKKLSAHGAFALGTDVLQLVPPSVAFPLCLRVSNGARMSASESAFSLLIRWS